MVSWREWLDRLAGLGAALLPRTCSHCGAVVAQERALCPDCWSSLHFLSPPACRRCALPLAHTAAEDETEVICAACRADPPPFARAWAVVRYDAASRGLLMRLKHGDRCELAAVMAALMVQARGRERPPPDVVVAVPLHPLRRLARRYNQAGLVAREIAERIGRPYLPFAVRRIRRTASQGGLSARQRHRNVAGAFRARKDQLDGRRVLVVDDVMTTGATLGAVARACLKAGAAEVEAVAFARTLPQGGDG